MTQSMTAFARIESNLNNLTITLELRSVNSRYLDITIRAPEECRESEQLLKTELGKQLSRGKVELNIRTHANAETDKVVDIELNMPLVEQIAKASHSIALHLHNADSVNPLDILRWPGVMQAKQINKKELQQSLVECLQQALVEFIETRQREGEKLATMLLKRCSEMEKIIKAV